MIYKRKHNFQQMIYLFIYELGRHLKNYVLKFPRFVFESHVYWQETTTPYQKNCLAKELKMLLNGSCISIIMDFCVLKDVFLLKRMSFPLNN